MPVRETILTGRFIAGIGYFLLSIALGNIPDVKFICLYDNAKTLAQEKYPAWELCSRSGYYTVQGLRKNNLMACRIYSQDILQKQKGASYSFYRRFRETKTPAMQMPVKIIKAMRMTRIRMSGDASVRDASCI